MTNIQLIVNGPDSKSLHDTVVITPDIARQIVALAHAQPAQPSDFVSLPDVTHHREIMRQTAQPSALPICGYPPNDAKSVVFGPENRDLAQGLPVAQPSGDDAAVEALSLVLLKDHAPDYAGTPTAADWVYSPFPERARAILSAIRAGKVPGVHDGAPRILGYDEAIAALRERLSEAERERDEAKKTAVFALEEMKPTIIAQYNQAKADLAAANERAVRLQMAHKGAHDALRGAEAQRDAANERAHQVTLQWEAVRLAKEAARMAARDANERAEAGRLALCKLSSAIGNPCVGSDVSLEDGLVVEAIRRLEAANERAEKALRDEYYVAKERDAAISEADAAKAEVALWKDRARIATDDAIRQEEAKNAVSREVAALKERNETLLTSMRDARAALGHVEDSDGLRCADILGAALRFAGVQVVES